MARLRYRITISLFTVIILVFGCINRTDGLKQTDIKPLVAVFLSKHVKYNTFDDELSKRTLSNLINYIDPGKYYFYKSDIDRFTANETKIDDYVQDGKFSMLFDIFDVYRNRFNENMALFDELIKLNYDFNKDETIVVDHDKTPYPATKEEMHERWRKNIKLQLLNYLNAVKDINEAKEKLKNKYRLNKKRIEEIDEDKMISMFINAFSTALDPHSNYLSQEEHEDFMISTKLKLEGIGVLLRSDDGFVIVESIMPGGAAAKLPAELSLKPNDKIIAVAQSDGEPVDVVDLDLRDVVKMIRGKSGTTVKLTILRKADVKSKQTRITIPIVREEIKLEDRAAKSDIFVLKRGTAEIKIGYIKLPSFYLDFDAAQKNDPNTKSSSTDIIRHINRLKNLDVQCIIIDLRGNPGGALTEAVNVAGLFIDQGPIVEIKSGSSSVEAMNDDDAGVYYDGPLVVLIDKFSASASEIFAGAIKDYRRGIIIGPTSTFGKGSVQTYNPLPQKKGAVKITTALFYQPAGTSNQLNGIAPDIYIPDMSSIWEIGEDKLRHPIRWEKIKGDSYVPYRNYVTAPIISGLAASSSKRVSGMKDFTELKEKIDTLKKRLNSREISLKEEATIEKNKIRDMERQIKKENDEKIIDLENDLFLREAFNVSADYYDMMK